MSFCCALLKKYLPATALVVAMSYTPSHAQVQVKEPTNINPEWNKDYEPFRIAGNLYYVGTYDLACYLVTSPQGHILINTGLAASADMIKKHVEQLGFKMSDIKILLLNQAHYDHMGAVAAIKKSTGAKLMVDAGDVKVVESGGEADYILGKYGVLFAPVKVDRVLHDGDEIKLGKTSLTMLHHPGHTTGSCSFVMETHDGKRAYSILIANMPKMLPEVEPAGMKGYPNVAKDFEYTYSAMPKLKFDLWVAAHASQFNLHEKHKPGDAYNPEAFRDQKGYEETIAELHQEYLDKKNGKKK